MQVRPDILSGLIWIQSVCKGYQNIKLAGKDLKGVCAIQAVKFLDFLNTC